MLDRAEFVGREVKMELNGAVAVVTGGNGGLGQRICHKLAEAGVHIAVVYAQSAGDAEAVAETLRQGHQVDAQAFQCDVTDAGQVSKLVDDVVAKFGRLDILINDAAYNKAIAFQDLDNLTNDIWAKILDVNLTGPMMCCKAVAPVMARQKQGRIVNIASVAGLAPTGSSIAYAVSKAGLIHLTRCMAVALAPHTLVNCVAPGLIEGTRATANLSSAQVENASKTALLKKAADKDDCADQVVTLCRTNTTTGQTIVIDAGRIFH
jgi:ketoreductase RED2